MLALVAATRAASGVGTPAPTPIPVGRRASDRIAARLRDDIRAGRLAPGQRLVEADLTQRLAVSRGPVREALARLESEGLVTIETSRGARVRQMSRDEIAELFWVRASLSADAAGLAARRIGEGDGAARMRQELARQRELGGAGLVAYAEANVRFHTLIDELSGNRVLARLLRGLETHAGVFLHLARASNTQRLLDEHVAIAEAILAADTRAAKRAARRHVETVFEACAGLADEWFE
jgi:DNA-binding GntR family transcriptional regulator